MPKNLNNPSASGEHCSSCGQLKAPAGSKTPLQILDTLHPSIAYLRQKGLLQLLPFSPATLWRKVKAGDFPTPVKFSPHITAWKRSDVRSWLQSIGP